MILRREKRMGIGDWTSVSCTERDALQDSDMIPRFLLPAIGVVFDLYKSYLQLLEHDILPSANVSGPICIRNAVPHGISYRS